MMTHNIKELKARAASLAPIVRIGKNGLSENQVKDIRIHLEKRGLIKVKLLPSFYGENDRKMAAQEIAAKAGAELVSRVGFIIVLYKPGAGLCKTGLKEKTLGTQRRMDRKLNKQNKSKRE